MKRTTFNKLLTAAIVTLLCYNVVAQTDITNLTGTVSAQYTDSPTNEGIAKVIDNLSSTKYLTFHASGWIQFQSTASYVATKYSITSANDADARDPKDWTFQGSSNGTTWTTIDTRTNEDFATRLLRREFTVTNTTAYSYYRLQMTNNSGTILQLSEWEIFGQEPTITTVYKHCNYSTTGYAVALPLGDYTTAQLTAKGISNNDISSLKISSGYEVVLYDLDNFAGTSVTVKADNSCLTNVSFNDKATSLRVRVATVNQPPTVSITAPVNNASFTAPANITITANAADADGSVTKVEFYNGTNKLGEDLTTPYSFAWNSVVAGTYTITAIATDNATATTTSSAITIVVNAPNQLPTVNINAPLNNASFAAPANITVTANASDADGSVTKVEFFEGSNKLGEDLTTPYSIAWNNVAAGSYTLTAKATDNATGATTSAAILVTVTVTTTERDITDFGGLMTTQSTSAPSNEGIANLVDNSSTTKFLTFEASTWVQLQQANASVVTRYTFTSANDADARDPKDWTFQGSNDGTAWTTLDTRANEDFPSRFQKREFTFTNSASFTYYRINMTNNSGTILQLAEVEIFGTGGGGNVIPTPPLTWQENWFDHVQLLSRVFYDDDVAIYYDNDMSRSITWFNTYVGDAWRYSKQVYGDMSGGGPDKRLYAVFHENKYGGGHPSYYFDGSHGYRNVIDVGQNGSWVNPTGWNLDATIHEIGHVVESTTNNGQGSPAFPLWGDSKWCVIYQYDVYLGLGWNSDATRWYKENINKTDSYPRANTYWFRDWFYPVWNNYGKSAVLSNFFELMSQHFPKNGKRYTRDMNYGEFIHFWSGAAGVNLKAQATIAFGWPAEWETQFNAARAQFPGITYSEPIEQPAMRASDEAKEIYTWNEDEGETLMINVPNASNSIDGKLEIYSSQGKVEIKKTIAVNERMAEVDISTLTSGLHVVVLENNGEVYRTTVVISK